MLSGKQYRFGGMRGYIIKFSDTVLVIETGLFAACKAMFLLCDDVGGGERNNRCQVG